MVSTTYAASDPRTGHELPERFNVSTAADVRSATDAAAAAFSELRSWSSRQMAHALSEVASQLERAGEALVAAADEETALGIPRLTGELARTVAQFRAFASLCAEGSYVEAIIDHARPDAVPPVPDLRRLLVPVGPVAVFGASNFPLAFSVPGGDTASALAARCSVVVKAHPSHPRTSDLAAVAIRRGLDTAGAPKGAFSVIHGPGPEVGAALVEAPAVRAVAFTGSTRGGRALFDLASQRPEPIPVYAEMSSVNPFLVTERALRTRGDQVAEGFAASLTQGSGQFCTKPGIALVPDSEAGLRWARRVAEVVENLEVGPLLNQGIHASFVEGMAQLASHPGVDALLHTQLPTDAGYRPPRVLVTVDARTFAQTPSLAEEHFGPFCVVVRCRDLSEMAATLAILGGNLAATVHGELEDLPELRTVITALEEGAGRVIWNGYPTGVAVTAAMMHGGPYPASTSSLHTSVGTTAIRRFLRPVAYQGFPENALPPELLDSNPLGILRLVDSEWTRDGRAL